MPILNNSNNPSTVINRITKQIKTLSVICIILLIIIPVIIHIKTPEITPSKNNTEKSSVKITSIPDSYEIPPFEETPEGKLAAYGYDLITKTYALLGPNTKLAVSGNRLSCTSCHLNGGTKPYAAPYIGLTALFPIYIGRENKIESLEERINGCFERSMNGKPLEVNSTEMRAMISYIKHLSKDVPVGQRLAGQGFMDLEVPNRAADLKHGAIVYKDVCATCHGKYGEGLKGSSGNKDGGYIYPQLWGEDTYNDGAGMSRILTAAKFIKGNMPLGVSHDAPQLSDEQAYDVAAYINSQSRPTKVGKEHDYPDLSKKPKDAPYPPYNDNITPEQHKYGPFNFES